MARPSKSLDRLKRLPIHATDEVWEVALASMPVVVAEEDKRSRGPFVPYRPVLALCISNKGGAQMATPDRPTRLRDEALIDALVAFAFNPLLPGTTPLTYLPSRVFLRATPLVKCLGPAARLRLTSSLEEDEGERTSADRDDVETVPPGPLWKAAVDRFLDAAKSLGIMVEVKAESPLADEFIDGFVRLSDELDASPDPDRELEGLMRGPMRAPALMKAEGMSVDRIRAFAEAATAFHRAAPWRHSGSEIIWKIEPAPRSRGLGYCTVMGALGEEFGVAFFTHPDQVLNADPGEPSEFFENAGGTVWSVLFDGEEFVPRIDAALWREHGLPRTADGSCPMPIGYRAGVKRSTITRPSAEQLNEMEAVLRAFAGTTRKEVNAGLIRAKVGTFDGPREMVFTAVVTF